MQRIACAGFALALAACSGTATPPPQKAAEAEPLTPPSSASTTAPDAPVLPLCAAGDTRILVPVWTPALDTEDRLSSDPPQQDGQVVYADLQRPSSMEACGAEALHSFTRPGDAAEGYPGGLAVNMRGHVHFDGGICRLRGFYVNRDVPGMHQGWIETSFEAIDTDELIAAGQHCLERAAP